MQFLSQINQEVASQVHDFNSPPTSPLALYHAAESNDLPEQNQQLMDTTWSAVGLDYI